MSPQYCHHATSQYKLFINDELNKFQTELNDYSRNDRLDKFYSDVTDIEKYEEVSCLKLIVDFEPWLSNS